jgi:hypothetical protein
MTYVWKKYTDSTFLSIYGFVLYISNNELIKLQLKLFEACTVL